MSRRFGRNQKRRMRAEVANAKAETAMIAGVARDNAAARDRALDHATDLEGMLYDAARVVGNTALVAGEPTKFEADWLRAGKGRFRMQPPQFMPAVPSFGDLRGETAVMIHDEVMRLLEVEPIRESLSRMMHVRVTLDEIPLGYAVSDSALHGVPEDILAEKMARELRPLLVNAIQELKGRRR